MLAVLFFVAVGVLIGLGAGWGLGHTSGIVEGRRIGREEATLRAAHRFDARLSAALRLREHRDEFVRPVVPECAFIDTRPFDIEAQRSDHPAGERNGCERG